MPKFSVMLLQEVSVVVDVEADSVEEARELAEANAPAVTNISTEWEESGECRSYSVYDENNNRVWSEKDGEG